jgi:hypothetical protein
LAWPRRFLQRPAAALSEGSPHCWHSVSRLPSSLSQLLSRSVLPTLWPKRVRGCSITFLDYVIEGQSFWSLLTRDWATAVRFYVTPALALIVLGIRLRKGGTAAEWTLAAS